jgi:hypothetical protein
VVATFHSCEPRTCDLFVERRTGFRKCLSGDNTEQRFPDSLCGSQSVSTPSVRAVGERGTAF